jgi:type IV secretory pathway VirB10-like protein
MTAPVKEDPEALALRAKPRPVARLNRRTLLALAAVLAVAVFGATLWGLRLGRGQQPGGPQEFHEIDRVAQAEGLETLPKDYAKLGPPLGEFGRPIVREERARDLPTMPEKGTFESNPEENAARAERLRLKQEDDQADKARVLFEVSQRKIESVAKSAADLAAQGSSQSQEGSANSAKAAASIYASGKLETPRSPDELLAGTLIPAALVTGINSDLPGQVIAEVSENVYDTVTGARLLVPQGSRLIGEYGNSVAFGQQRILLVFMRLIMPDGSSITLDRLNGTDLQGEAGAADKVDFHWRRLFGAAILSTVIAAGAELAYPAQQTTANGTVVIAARQSLQDSITDVGQQITRKNLEIQPTITIRPGFPIRVIVNRDLVLRQYVQSASQVSSP